MTRIQPHRPLIIIHGAKLISGKSGGLRKHHREVYGGKAWVT